MSDLRAELHEMNKRLDAMGAALAVITVGLSALSEAINDLPTEMARLIKVAIAKELRPSPLTRAYQWLMSILN